MRVAQPSVSDQPEIPVEHDPAVEAAGRGVRAFLQAGLPEVTPELDDADSARAAEYALLATLLLRAPEPMLLKRIAMLPGDETPLGIAHAALAQAAKDGNCESIEREFFDLFIGVGRGKILPYASYYLTGFLNERPLARLRTELRALGIERAGEQSEPEDHAGILCEVMAGLIKGPFASSLVSQRQFFEKHLASWIGRFFADLKAAAGASFYGCAGAAGHCFIQIEREAFRLAM